MLARRHFITGLAASGAASACATTEIKAPPRPAVPIPSGTLLTAERLDDALLGSSYLGCGGGGSLRAARELIAADLTAGRTFSIMDVDGLPDDARVACPYALASLAPVSADHANRLAQLETQVEAPTLAAFRLLEHHLNTRFSGVILGEIGPLSMAEGLSIAAHLGVPALDADTVGRATPEINQHSVRVAGHALTPAAGVTPFGDEVILHAVQDPSREEDIFRNLSRISQLVGVTDAPISGAIAKSGSTLIKNSFSLAASIGQAVREAIADRQDPLNAARAAGDGYLLFKGRIEGFDWEDRDGFLAGDITLAGTGNYAGQSMRLDYKNEHLVARRNGDIIATCPDLITLIDLTTYEGVANPEFTIGQAVGVLGFRAHPVWRSIKGLNVFSPRYFGYDIDYRPIEKRLVA